MLQYYGKVNVLEFYLLFTVATRIPISIPFDLNKEAEYWPKKDKVRLLDQFVVYSLHKTEGEEAFHMLRAVGRELRTGFFSDYLVHGFIGL